jgi:hypothetical protein
MNSQSDIRGSIVNHIIDGRVKIDSEGEFENLLRVFPNNPSLYRAFGDWLAQRKSFDAAADTYGMAAELFIDSGMMLQAMVSKILQWRITQPSHPEAREFHAAVSKGGSQDGPLHNFLTGMAYPEMVGIMASWARVRLPAGSMVKRFGDAEDNLYFIVSGALKETTYLPLEEGEEVHKKLSIELVEDDFFGAVYPFEEEKLSQSNVETIVAVELVKISRPRLRVVCNKYPNVEDLVSALHKTRSVSGRKISFQTVRRAVRHQLPTKVTMKIFAQEEDKAPLVVDGFTEDMSSGGACIVLGSNYYTGSSANVTGKNVKIEIALPTADAGQNVFLGKILWSKEFSQEGRKTSAVGVQFEDVKEPDRAVLEQYCSGSAGEQNLMWSLWESLVQE